MKNNKIVIFALCWRDIKHPKMGGAEVYTHEMLKRAAEAGMEIIHMAPFVEGQPEDEVIDGVRYLRQGNLMNLIGCAKKYYKSRETEIDIVIDQCNTYRFFTKFWVPQEKRLFFIHQLTREIWDINMKWPASKIGKALETPMLRLEKDDMAIAVSESTRQDLINVGFDPKKVMIVPEGNDPAILGKDVDWERGKKNDFIFVGRYSKYKGIDISVEALGIVKKQYPDAKLYIVGKKDQDFVKTELQPICDKYNMSIGDDDSKDVVCCGFVSGDDKFRIMSDARALLFPSLREGWGLIITEAGAMGTPSITCDLPGTRDAVDRGRTGYLCKDRTAQAVAKQMISSIEDKDKYIEMSHRAYEFANTLTWDRTGQVFIEVVNQMMQGK